MKRFLAGLLAAVLIPTLAAAQSSGPTRCVSATPTVDTSAYATGDLIGGKLTFSPAAGSSTKGTGYIVSANITDKADQSVDLELVLFRSNPTTTTFTDQAAFDPSDADLANVVAVISLPAATTFFTYNDNGVHFLGSLAIPFRGITLYGALVSRGTPTFSAASDVTVNLCASVD